MAQPPSLALFDVALLWEGEMPSTPYSWPRMGPLKIAQRFNAGIEAAHESPFAP